MQNWRAGIISTPKLNYYKDFKVEFKYEEYLDYISNSKHRIELTRFRLSAHNLEIETGRFNNINRDNRICTVCNSNMIETEYHFLLCCTYYSDIRTKFIRNPSWPTYYKFLNILRSQSKTATRNLARYIYHVTMKRDQSLSI